MRIALRADSYYDVGMGLLMKAMAIASVIGGDISFIIKKDKQAKDRLVNEGFSGNIIEINAEEDVPDILEKINPDIFIAVLKSPPYYLEHLNSMGVRTVMVNVFPDACRSGAHIDIFSDMREGGYAAPEFLVISTHTRSYRAAYRVKSTCKRIFVAQGGTDPFNLSTKIMKSLLPFNEKIDLVLGPMFRFGDELKPYLKANVTAYRNVSQKEIAGLMSHADLSICAGGDTLLELMCIGVPAIVVNHHQKQNDFVKPFSDAGCVLNLGIGTSLDEAVIRSAVMELSGDYEKRNMLSIRSKKMVDGKGAERIKALIFKD